MSSKNIVKGYKGIMDLDLNLVPIAFHKEAVEQHYKDIKEYKIYQAQLPNRLRYENVIPRIEKLRQQDIYANKKRMQEEYDTKSRQYARVRCDFST